MTPKQSTEPETALWGSRTIVDPITALKAEETLQKEGNRLGSVPAEESTEADGKDGDDKNSKGRTAASWDPAVAAEIVSKALLAECDSSQTLWVYSPSHGHRIAGQEGTALFKRAVMYLHDWWRPGEKANGSGGAKFTTRKFNEALEIASVQHPSFLPGIPNNHHLLGFENGVLDLLNINGGLHPHSPTHGITRLIRHRWNPKAKAPKFLDMVRRTIPDPSEAKVFVEAVGVCLSELPPPQQMVVVIGPGETGKSQIIRIPAHLLGEGNYVAISPQTLGDGKFDFARLRNKAANLPADITGMRMKDTGPFKEALGGDPVSAAVKFHQEGITFRSRAAWLGAGNELPSPGIDRSDAFRRRFYPLGGTMEKMTTDTEGWVDNFGDHVVETEAEGIIVEAVKGLARYLKRGGAYPALDSVQERVMEWWWSGNEIALFVHSKIAPDPAGRIPYADVEEAFRTWCSECGYNSEAIEKRLGRGLANHLTREITSAVRGAKRVGGKGRPYIGITLLPDPNPDPGPDDTDSTEGNKAIQDITAEIQRKQRESIF